MTAVARHHHAAPLATPDLAMRARAPQRATPLVWRRRDRGHFTIALRGMVSVDPHAPVVHSRLFGADVYARWAGARPPTESEWEHPAGGLPADSKIAGDHSVRHPLPPAQPATSQPIRMCGDVWKWSSSDYGPYPGYGPAAGAVGESNREFMCGQCVVRSGSCATSAGHVRASDGNVFPPAAPWQCGGLRLTRDSAPA